MQLDRLWPVAGDTASPRDAGVEVYEEHPDCFWLVRHGEMRGPFDRRSILRALRVACTPLIDGCELGPSKSGFFDLPGPHPFNPRLTQSFRDPSELPESMTRYTASVTSVTKGADGEIILARSWNLHPKGSRVIHEADGTVTVIDGVSE